MSMKYSCNDTVRRKRKYSEQTWPIAMFSTANPTYTNLASNSSLCFKRPETNHVSQEWHGLNLIRYVLEICFKIILPNIPICYISSTFRQ
jgi:hypothetical protein